MTKEDKTDRNMCSRKRKLMFVYGFIQLGSTVVSAIALSVIALSFCTIKKESKIFNDCVDEVQATGKSFSGAVRFCNGGK
ncbi:hypothetical protein [Prochlorococcus sp. MIT 0916]|uniref:hypothetical protein n=1 Tax=Prochlorococcus sp. MIT 0916 TaxID=3082521 RepID=UPI0039B3AAF6